MRLLRYSPFLLIFLFVFSSCQDDPTSLGKDLIGDQLEILVIDSNLDSLNQSSSSFLADSLSYGASTTLLLGNLDYLKSTMLVRFGAILPDSVNDKLDAGTLSVLSAEVELRPIYKVGDLNQSFGFTVHNITSDWGSVGFNADSLAMLTYDANEITSSKTITDSLIQFNLNNDIALDWLEALGGDSLSNNYGMIFLPQAGSNLIYGFRAFQTIQYDDRPLLRFVVQDSESNIDTIITRVVFDVHLPQGSVPQVTEDKMQLTAGLGERGNLFFDVTRIPLNVNINKAELAFKVDSLNSLIGSPDADSMRVHMLADSSDFSIDSDQPVLRLRFDGKEFKGDITRFIQAIISGKENLGFQLSLSNEVTGADRYVIYGSTFADRTLRPKLTIYYNVFN